MEKTGEKGEKLLQTVIQERGQISPKGTSFPCYNTAQADLVKSGKKDFALANPAFIGLFEGASLSQWARPARIGAGSCLDVLLIRVSTSEMSNESEKLYGRDRQARRGKPTVVSTLFFPRVGPASAKTQVFVQDVGFPFPLPHLL